MPLPRYLSRPPSLRPRALPSSLACFTSCRLSCVLFTASFPSPSRPSVASAPRQGRLHHLSCPLLPQAQPQLPSLSPEPTTQHRCPLLGSESPRRRFGCPGHSSWPGSSSGPQGLREEVRGPRQCPPVAKEGSQGSALCSATACAWQPCHLQSQRRGAQDGSQRDPNGMAWRSPLLGCT